MEYQIEGAPLPVVICQLEAGETMLTERGSMSWMTPNMKMETSTNGGLGKAFGRMLSGDSIFQNGGEGFIMQKLSGRGIAFTEFDGHIVEYDLDPGESLVVDTGYLAAMDATCSMDIQAVPGLKNMVFGGEGIFNTIITGPGLVYLQTMPISQVAGVLRPFMPTAK